MIDPSIPLQVRGINLAELGEAYYGARDAADRRRANRLQATLAGIQLSDAQDEARYNKTLNGLLQLNTEEGPAGLTLNEDQTVKDLNRLGFGRRALGLQSEFRKNRADALTQKRQQYLDRLDIRSRILDGATAADYGTRLRRLSALGDDLEGLPRQFNDQAVKSHLNEVLTRKEKLEQMGKDAKALADKTAAELEGKKQEFEQGAKFNETKRHNEAMEDVGRRQAEAAAGAKEITLGRLPPEVVTKLSDVGGKVDTFNRLITSASPNFFGGSVLNKLGDSFTVDAMRALGVGNETVNWWQDYNTFKNEMRHGIFGASLTPGEKSEFERTIITPRMDPDLAMRNLQRQYELATKAAEKMVKAYEAGGYNRTQISAALGRPSASTGAPGGLAPAPGAPAAGGAPAAPQGQIKAARGGGFLYVPTRQGG